VWRFGSFNAVVLFPSVPSLGASGAIASHGCLYSPSRAEILTLIPLDFIFRQCDSRVLLSQFWFLQQAFYGLASLEAPSNIGMESGGIALHWAHAGFPSKGPLLGCLSQNHSQGICKDLPLLKHWQTSNFPGSYQGGRGIIQ